MIKVYYDGICGYCSKEINHYRKISSANVFEWIDVAREPDAMIRYNITQAEALLFLHAVDCRDNIHVGSEAFAMIWKHLPKWWILGHLISLPIISFLSRRLYVWFAKRRFNGYRHCQLASNNFSKN